MPLSKITVTVNVECWTCTIEMICYLVTLLMIDIFAILAAVKIALLIVLLPIVAKFHCTCNLKQYCLLMNKYKCLGWIYKTKNEHQPNIYLHAKTFLSLTKISK